MNINITSGIQIGGFLYPVKMDTGNNKALRAVARVAECDNLNHCIGIDTDQSPESISENFLHEAIEAINHIYCHDELTHDKITQLGYGLHQVMESLGVKFGRN